MDVYYRVHLVDISFTPMQIVVVRLHTHIGLVTHMRMVFSCFNYWWLCHKCVSQVRTINMHHIIKRKGITSVIRWRNIIKYSTPSGELSVTWRPVKSEIFVVQHTDHWETKKFHSGWLRYSDIRKLVSIECTETGGCAVCDEARAIFAPWQTSMARYTVAARHGAFGFKRHSGEMFIIGDMVCLHLTPQSSLRRRALWTRV